MVYLSAHYVIHKYLPTFLYFSVDPVTAVRDQFHRLVNEGRIQEASQLRHELDILLFSQQSTPSNVAYTTQGNRQ